MCGICGIFNFGKTNPVEENQIRKMCNVMIHRGPDDEGIFVEKKIGLGMRRLAIIDLETGHQPIFNEDKSICIVLNGEIYNFQELRIGLEKMGHKFYTKTDVETVIHLYEEYKEKCVEHLRGMFAFALWDIKNQKLFLARDRLGKKPLFYTIQNGSLIFASEMKSILEVIGRTPEIDFESIDFYLTYQYISSPGTIFKTIKRLQPANILICDKNGNIKIEKYWDLDFTKKTNLSFKEASQRIREILIESTKLRLISDVPLGAFLSGGHDSTIIVGLMSQLQSRPVKTFSIGFEDQDFSELKYAKIVAKKFNTEHNEFIVKP
ncbi:MAG: asparagine synthase (glutamine-hydrolyzing), partial [Endomicrobiia bacterium]